MATEGTLHAVQDQARLAVPFWNINIPKDEWTDTCPTALRSLDKDDQAQLATRDEDYQLMTWMDVKSIIITNRLDLFKRVPSELRRYRFYIEDLKQRYGSVMNFISKERLKWQDLTPRADPFEESVDLKVLYNDWPYGIDPKIVHLVVWTKFELAEDPETGDLTEKTRKRIDEYVTATFRNSENPGSVLWFKNWAALKSVHAVEHFHVMLYDPDLAFIKSITNGNWACFEGNERIL